MKVGREIMGDVDMIAAISFAISLLSLGALMFVIRKQYYEVLIPRDWLTRLRWIIFSTLLASIIGLVPVIAYQYIRMFGGDSETLRSVATVTGNIGRLASTVLLVMIYTYRKKE